MQTNPSPVFSFTSRTSFSVFKVIALAYLPLTLAAQNQLNGTIRDSETGKPVAFASVFFANTTLGTSSNTEGVFVINRVPSGKFDLTVTMVGYQTYQRSVEFHGQDVVELDVSLVPDQKMLSEVLVKPDTAGWKRNYRDFVRNFLGTTKYAEECIIQNPKDILLFFDPSDGVLVAHAKKPIIVDNHALGYRIEYYLKAFELNSRAGTFLVYGIPRFELLTPRNEREARKWERERAQVYSGSLLHFMRAWQTGQWQREDFAVARLYRIPNRERPPEEFLRRKIKEFRQQALTNGSLTIQVNTPGKKEDSLSYYLRLQRLPPEVDSVANEELTGREFATATLGQMAFRGNFRVVFREWEDMRYTQSVGRPPEKRMRQTTVLHVYDHLQIYDNGYYELPQSVLLEGYWSWSEKISTTLPLEYQPPVKK
jgi:hypothetical protein